MRAVSKAAAVALLAVIMCFGLAPTAQARVFVGVGFGFPEVFIPPPPPPPVYVAPPVAYYAPPPVTYYEQRTYYRTYRQSSGTTGSCITGAAPAAPEGSVTTAEGGQASRALPPWIPAFAGIM